MPLPVDSNASEAIWNRLKLPGWHPTTFAIALNGKFRCAYCDLKFYESYEKYLTWTLDHVIPIAKDGSDEPENKVPCCKICNSIKGQWDPSEAIGPDKSTEEYVQAVRDRYAKLRKARQEVFEDHRDRLRAEGLID